MRVFKQEMSLFLSILVFMRAKISCLAEHEKSIITSGPVFLLFQVLEKLSTFLTPAERNILQEITEKT